MLRRVLTLFPVLKNKSDSKISLNASGSDRNMFDSRLSRIYYVRKSYLQKIYLSLRGSEIISVIDKK